MYFAGNIMQTARRLKGAWYEKTASLFPSKICINKGARPRRFQKTDQPLRSFDRRNCFPEHGLLTRIGRDVREGLGENRNEDGDGERIGQ